MARRRGRHPKQGPWTPSSSAPRPRSGVTAAEPELVRSIRRAVEAGPVATLEAASSLLAASRMLPAELRPTEEDSAGRLDIAELIHSFVDAPFPVMRVMAAAMLPMLDDELLAHRVRHQLEQTRIPAAPVWLDDLTEPELTGTLRMPDPLGDGENLLISVAWHGRRSGTVMVYVDHNMGTIVKDAFVVPQGLDEARAMWAGIGGDDLRIEEIDPADARARITEAIRASDLLDPPYETDTWPAVRPLVEWWASLLPDGGAGFVRRAVPAHEIEELAVHFARSAEAGRIDLPADTIETLVVPLLWFAAQSEPGDPLRWSPVSVEVALVDWIPTHVLLPTEELPILLPILEALVRFAHRERGIGAEHTTATIEAIDQWAPAMLSGAADLDLAALPDDAWDDGFDLDDLFPGGDADLWDDDEDDDDLVPLTFLPTGEIDILTILDRLERRIIRAMGGAAAAASLGRDPLPPHRVDPTVVTDDLADLIEDIGRRIDEVCAAELDDELASICHHYLEALLEADQAVFRRSARADLIAAGLVWTAITIQHHVDGRPSDPSLPTQKRLAEVMGVAAGSLSGRARTIRRALEERTEIIRQGPWHSARRRHWLDELDQLRRTRASLLDRLDED